MDVAGPLYRALHPAFASDPLSGEGARLYGGRFNRRGRPALYLTAAFDALRREVGRAGSFQPSVVIELAVDLRNLFDACDPDELAHHGWSPDDLADPEWRLKMHTGQTVSTQNLAEGLVGAGHLGMVTPSYAPGADPRSRNVILWHWGPDLPARVELVDDEGRLR